MANDQTVQVEGTAHVKMFSQGEKHTIFVYILKQTLHPFILGTSYLIQNKISLNFGNMVANVRCTKRITIPPHSEMVVLGKLPKNSVHGYQGLKLFQNLLNLTKIMIFGELTLMTNKLILFRRLLYLNLLMMWVM